MPRVLIIDDDPVITKYLAGLLRQGDYDVRTVLDPRAALAAAGDFQPDVTILDLAMPHKDGLELLPELRAACPRAQVIIYTGAGNVEKAVRAMKDGAFDFLQKPGNYDAVLLSVTRAIEVRQLREENVFLREAYDAQQGPGAILVFSDSTRATLDLAERYRANPDVPVLIEGESGTGKELVARYIHYDGADYSRPFVPINCGAIPGALVEAELFGYTPGAFTGARAEGAPGKISAAEGGTLFLDELGELDLGAQVKVLRFLEHGTFFPVGGHKETCVQTRVICATNRRLDEAVAQGHFRRDLYYRVLVGYIQVPPLRERRQEILPFARHFLREFSERFDNPFEGFEPAAEQTLLHAPWLGNVRELRNAIERIVLIGTGPLITPAHLAFLRGTHADAELALPGPAEAPLPDDALDLELVTLRLIERALEKHNNNQSRAARYLNITRETLRYRMQKHNLLDLTDIDEGN